MNAPNDARQRILAANEAAASALRERFRRDGTLVVNLISSPGSGKTSLLEATVGRLAADLKVAVIEGDIATERDAERIARLGVPAHQILTGGACHLDARQVEAALAAAAWGRLDVLFVENVGNLICPAEFDLGEWGKIAVLSVAEGDDKVEKYPLLFSLSRALVITKLGMLPHTNFRMAEAERCFRRVNRNAPIIPLDSVTGDGFGPWIDFVERAAGTGRV